MLQEVLQSIEGIAVYPMVGLFIFVFAFVYVIVSTWRLKKEEVDYFSRLPLDKDTIDPVAESSLPRENRPGEM